MKSAWENIILVVGAFAEVARRIIFGSKPDAPIMVIVALAALAANVTSMWLLGRYCWGGTAAAGCI